MAKIAFDVKFRPQIESGEYKVETRDGRPARIICWDRKPEDGSCIVALVNDGICELGYSFQNTGRFWSKRTDPLDLFIITPEPELTEFEKKVYGMITNKFCVKEWSKTLLDLARKQIEAEKKQSKRLPTIEEWKWLISNCKWEWDDARKGRIIAAKNGNSIFLPAAGFGGTSLRGLGIYGSYWSSSHDTGDYDLAYCVYFDSGCACCDYAPRYFLRSVRFVSDTPQDGFVDMGNNLFWAVENEDGYYTHIASDRLD